MCAAEMEEPKTMNQAKKRPDAQKWMKAEGRNCLVDGARHLVTDQTTPWMKDHR